MLGGAPFNAAWHLRALGLDPLLITRVGNDDLGDRIIAAMVEWGMDTRGVQRDLERPTGAVEVSLGDDGPAYEIVPDRAWDALDGAQALAAVAGAEAKILYHGSLIARGERSAATLNSLRSVTGLPVFLDVNLRDPWWDGDTVRHLLFGTRWLKLNEEELRRLGEAPEDGTEVTAAVLRAVRTRYALDTVVLTRGAEGALVVGPAGAIEGAPPQSVPEVDTVGAGDAFSAVWIAGLLLGWPERTTFDRATAFASLVCGVRGGVIAEPEVYARLREQWTDALSLID
jgi:fructokinase